MNKDAALASLGLSGNEDPVTIARVYGERLSGVQERLVAAQTDADRSECQTKLSHLVEAYELVTETGRYTRPGLADASATVMRTATEMAQPRPGDTLVRLEPGVVLASRLEVGPLLGQGGMGNVYAARDRLKEEDVAIKVLRQDLLFSVAAKERFLAEAKVSCSLSHPNIVRVHDVGVSGDYYYFSMERLQGHTLRQRMEAYHQENHPFGVAEVRDIARQLIDALRYAHRYIVHRDLKPENIWLAEDGTVKLMDFGIARAFSSSQLTQTGMTLGTAYYMAPEQRLASKEVDWRADQYALGVVLYELLAGTLPTGAVRPIETLRRDLPKRYARALMRAMAPKPEDRFPSLNALLEEIEAPGRGVAFAIGAILLIGVGVAAAAGGVYILMTRPDTTDPASAVAALDAGQRSGPAAPAASSTLAATQPKTDSGQQSSVDAAPGGGGPTDGTPPVEAPSAGALPAGPSSAEASPTEPSTLRPASAGAAPLAQTKPQASATDAAPTAATTKPLAQAPQRMASMDRSQEESRRQQCIAQCERDDGECRSINRRGKQDCMRAVAFGSSGRLTTTPPAAGNCAFFGQARCDHALHRDACLQRIARRHQACVETLGGSIAARRQDCEGKARESDQLCLDELQDCRASC